MTIANTTTGATDKCVFPTQAAACPAISNTNNLSTLASQTYNAVPLSVLAAGASATYVVTAQLDCQCRQQCGSGLDGNGSIHLDNQPVAHRPAVPWHHHQGAAGFKLLRREAVSVVHLTARRWGHRAVGSSGSLCALLLVLAGAAGATGGFKAVVSSNGSFSAGTLQLEATTAGSVNCYSTGSGAGWLASARPTLRQCANGSPIPTGELSSTTSLQRDDDLDLGGKGERHFVEVRFVFVRSGRARRLGVGDRLGRDGPEERPAFGGVSLPGRGPAR